MMENPRCPITKMHLKISQTLWNFKAGKSNSRPMWSKTAELHVTMHYAMIASALKKLLDKHVHF